MEEWKHKGYAICIDSDGTFSCVELKLERQSSLKAIKAKMNEMLKDQIKDLKAYELEYGDKFKEVSIINIVNGWSEKPDFLVTAGGAKYRRDTLYKSTEQNRQLLVKISQLTEEKEKKEKAWEAEEEEIDEKIKQLKNQLEPLKPKEIKESGMILN